MPIFYWGNLNSWIRIVINLNISREIVGIENLPRKGPLILASNHGSEADPAILMTTIPRRIVFLAKRELFQIPFFGPAYHLYGCIPVQRFKADLKALRQSEEALSRGEILGMFPEGTRSRSGQLGKAAPGTALLALRSGVPILPVALSGNASITLPGSILKRTPVKIAIGKPFQLSPVDRIHTSVVQEASETIMRNIATLLPPELRGAYIKTQS